ncbi:MAG: RDD family protein [Gammaproteobacteria bacterium]|nr:RDD family protein [Gammaproteobacteria bacterium]
MQPAPLWRRLTALGYDLLLILGLNIFLSLIFIALQVPVPENGHSSLNQVNPVEINQPVLVLIWILATFFFYGWSWTRGGQTLGMRVWKVKAVHVDGGNMTWLSAAMRFIAAGLSWGVLGLGYLWALIDPAGRTWHDRLSKTSVIFQPLEKIQLDH